MGISEVVSVSKEKALVFKSVVSKVCNSPRSLIISYFVFSIGCMFVSESGLLFEFWLDSENNFSALSYKLKNSYFFNIVPTLDKSNSPILSLLKSIFKGTVRTIVARYLL